MCRDLLADWEDSASSGGGSPTAPLPVPMDVDDAQLPAPACEALSAAHPAEERDRGAAEVPHNACGGQPARRPAGVCSAAVDDGLTRRNAQRHGSVDNRGNTLDPDDILNPGLRHASRSPPKKVPRWRGRSGRGSGAPKAPSEAAQAGRAVHPADKSFKGVQVSGQEQAEATGARRSDKPRPLRAGASGEAGGDLAGTRAAAAGASSKAHAAVALLRFQLEQGSIEEVRGRLVQAPRAAATCIPASDVCVFSWRSMVKSLHAHSRACCTVAGYAVMQPMRACATLSMLPMRTAW